MTDLKTLHRPDKCDCDAHPILLAKIEELEQELLPHRISACTVCWENAWDFCSASDDGAQPVEDGTAYIRCNTCWLIRRAETAERALSELHKDYDLTARSYAKLVTAKVEGEKAAASALRRAARHFALVGDLRHWRSEDVVAFLNTMADTMAGETKR